MSSLSFLALLLAAAPSPEQLDRIEVSARGAPLAPAAAVARLDDEAIGRVAAAHPSELLRRVPGTWLSRGSGQESLLAIRSPVLTGPGACGSFLLLDDGIPLRPAGFCNVNQILELDTELAEAIEVLRGPGAAVHGSGALHGVLNLVPPAPGAAPARADVDLGPHGYRRLRSGLGGSPGNHDWRLDALGTSTGSFRDLEGYDQQKLRAQFGFPGAPGAPVVGFAASNLNQETAGYVGGFDAYRDARRRGNDNPEAYRDVDHGRLSARWGFALADARSFGVVAYARSDRTDFIQHFLPGKPLEASGSDSAGLQLQLDGATDTWHWQLGADLELARGELLQRQVQPVEDLPPAPSAIRPLGRHYDYHVDAVQAALFGQAQRAIGEATTLTAGLRAERLRYDYATRLAPGNLAEDGSACGFGGCLYLRPADRDDEFTGISGELGLEHALSEGLALRARLARGQRAPQASELYRLQRGQSPEGIDGETLDGAELGLRWRTPRLALALDGYAYAKREVILRDAQGLTVDDARTRHRGLELAADWRPRADLWLGLDVSRASHRYAFDRVLGGGETIRDGDAVDSAPRWLGSLRLGHAHPSLGEFELEWVHQGGYFADAANSAWHPGHELLHLRWSRAFGPRWSLAARLSNLSDRRYAERADFAFGDWRYFPGEGRVLHLTLGYSSAD